MDRRLPARTPHEPGIAPDPIWRLGAALLLFGVIARQVVSLETGLAGLGVPGTGLLYTARHGWMILAFAGSALVLLSPGALRNLSPAIRTWLGILVLYTIALSAFGLARGVDSRHGAFDSAVYITFAAGIVVGSVPQSWRVLHTYFHYTVVLGTAWIIVLLLASPVSLADMKSIRGLVRFGAEHYPLLSASMQGLINIAPFAIVLLTLNQASRHRRAAAIMAMVALSIALMLFGKRAPFARFALLVLVLMAWIPSARGFASNQASRWVRRSGWLVVLVASAILIVSILGGVQVVERASLHLTERYQTIGTRHYHVGFEGAERFLEVAHLFRDFSLADYLAGRGMGGGFAVPNWWGTGLALKEAGVPFYGVHTPHIGLAGPLIKGGVPFLVVFFFGWVRGVLRPQISALATSLRPYRGVLVISFFFMGIETMVSPGAMPSVLMLSVCVGRCLSIAPFQDDLNARPGSGRP